MDKPHVLVTAFVAFFTCGAGLVGGPIVAGLIGLPPEGFYVAWILGGLVGLSVPILWHVWKLAQIKRTEEGYRRKEALQGARNETERFETLKRNLRSTAEESVKSLASMPPLLRGAAASYSRARETFADGAFSPFWSAVEQSYQQLGQYRGAADQVKTFASLYDRTVSALVETGKAAAQDIPPYPIVLDVDRVEAAHNELVTALDKLVYDAQKVPTFATIWEQRRTTEAVVVGFQNLEQAVARMSVGLRSSFTELGVALSDSGDRVSRAVDGLRRESAGAARDQLAETKELTAHVHAIRDELYYPEIAHLLH